MIVDGKRHRLSTETLFPVMNRLIFSILLLLLASCYSSNNEEPDIIESSVKVSPSSLLFNYQGGEKRVEIDADMPWQIGTVIPDWIEILNKTDKYIDFKVKPNKEDNIRSQIVTILIENKIYCTFEIRQRPQEKLFFESKPLLIIDASKNQYKIKVTSNINYETALLNDAEEWIALQNVINKLPLQPVTEGTLRSNTITVNVDENSNSAIRKSKLVIWNESYEISDTLTIIQEGKENTSGGSLYSDGEYLCLQKATKGSADLVIMGEAFTSSDLEKEGKYEQCMKKAMNYFFNIEPFKSYREYFNVYMVVAESPTDKIGQKSVVGLPTRSNKFGTAYGSGTEIVCDEDLVFTYTRYVKELDADKPVLTIVVLNDDKYAGTTYLFSDGNAIALCPMSKESSPNDFEGVVHHEAGGHGFGFLCDEYVYYQTTIPEKEKINIQKWQKMGYQMNVDFTDSPEMVLWKDFIGLNQYDMVGLYEGAYMYQYGIWRSESNSCMNNNIPYYNTQSRWCIVKRIMELSGKSLTISEFLKKDKVSITSTRSVGGKEGIPLGNPVWIIK